MITQHMMGIGDVLVAETAEEERLWNQTSVARQRKWDLRFLDVARVVASWSKDPSTKVGAVLVCENNIISTGYNGFPRGMPDERLDDREHKYACTVHAEMNALLNAGLLRKPLTLYVTPLPPCERCAVHLLQAGVNRVVTGLGAGNAETREQWMKSGRASAWYLRRTGVEVVYYSEGE